MKTTTEQHALSGRLLIAEGLEQLEAATKARSAADLVRAMSPRERVGYSIGRAINLLISEGRGPAANCLEAEISRELAKTHNVRTHNSVLIPLPLALERDLSVASGGGAYLVGTEVGDPFGALRNRMFTAQFGAFMVPFTGDAQFPVVATGTAAHWLTDETTQITAGSETISIVSVTPKTVGVFTRLTRHLLLQAPQTDGFVRREFTRALAAALDAAVVNGAGSSGEPEGILQSGSVNAISGASLEWGDLLDAIVNAGDAGAGGFACAADAYKIAASREVVASTGVMCLRSGVIDGRPTVITSAIPNGTILTGPWDQVAVATWGALELMADPSTDFTSGQVGIRGMLAADVACARPDLFSAITSVS